jgi:hypothetical protein
MLFEAFAVCGLPLQGLARLQLAGSEPRYKAALIQVVALDPLRATAVPEHLPTVRHAGGTCFAACSADVFSRVQCVLPAGCALVCGDGAVHQEDSQTSIYSVVLTRETRCPALTMHAWQLLQCMRNERVPAPPCRGEWHPLVCQLPELPRCPASPDGSPAAPGRGKGHTRPLPALASTVLGLHGASAASNIQCCFLHGAFKGGARHHSSRPEGAQPCPPQLGGDLRGAHGGGVEVLADPWASSPAGRAGSGYRTCVIC